MSLNTQVYSTLFTTKYIKWGLSDPPKLPSTQSSRNYHYLDVSGSLYIASLHFQFVKILCLLPFFIL